MQELDVDLGLIEGFYGRPWTWEERAATIAFLAPHGYRFYLYAPKADPFLRRRWREPFAEETLHGLTTLAARCAGFGVRFGVGLSPYEIYRAFDEDAKADLGRKLAELDAIGVAELAILFDDMRGDLPGLAAAQIEIVHWIAERTAAKRLILCPTYYSDDPILDRAFGARPAGYLEELGQGLDPAIEVFWTGEEVCSRAYGLHHLGRVAETLRRKPVIWDNYPVNDGPVMSRSLHLRGFTGRPGAMGGAVRGHAVNPASQAVLSRVPALTLAESYRLGEAYDYGAAFASAAAEVLGEALAAVVGGQLAVLQDSGLDRLDDAAKQRLRARYDAFDHPAAREILAWLEGAWTITRAEMESS
ncbi:MAG TPA: beta-N-acetylglucosaminidase domain-containing protein [Caulobacteraceae bacterium]|nr:beta-N-acetylglucosaminidase domain-containing protein [Caulobacteraceae bacterium]